MRTEVTGILGVWLLLGLGAACSDSEGLDGGVADDAGAQFDGSPPTDTGLADAGEITGPQDASLDAGIDGAVDAGPDAAIDAGTVCPDRLTPAPIWPEALQELPLQGQLQWGQTHVIRPEDTRLAPSPARGRASLLLFTPDDALPANARLQIMATRQGQPLGVLTMAAPGALPILEQSLTDVPLAPHAPNAHSAMIPWTWAQADTVLQIGYVDPEMSPSTRFVHSQALASFGAPHRFTVTRSKIVAFGEPGFDTATQPAASILQDFYASLPASELRWVDYAPWRVQSLVVQTDNGPRLVHSEAEREAVTDEDHWSILKNQFALRMSLANTGRGLSLTVLSEGDNSPFSFGTSVSMGWFRDPAGMYRDIDDAPWAAGWTGWTAMWAQECGNGFIHEVGHSMTLAHFTEGTAARWGIEAQYPNDGTNIEAHPWGFDSTRGALRTLYRVDSSGPVMTMNELVGKRDPMNGGEARNAVACFPQYTGYHAQKAQLWMQNQPTLKKLNGIAGVYQWDGLAEAYVSAPNPNFVQPVSDVDAPVVTLIGTISSSIATSQTYPALYSPSGNLFELPNPESPGLPNHFQDAQYFIEIDLVDGTTQRALIARPRVVQSAELFAYAVNLDAVNPPVQVRLYLADAPYPNLDPRQSTLLHTRDIGPPPLDLPPVLTAGRGQLANAALLLSRWCEPGINCENRSEERAWRGYPGAISFSQAQPVQCSVFNTQSTLRIPVIDGDGGNFEVVVHAQRIVEGQGLRRAVPLQDRTSWIEGPDVTQSVRLWMPLAENQALPPGHYRTGAPYELSVQLQTPDGQSTALDPVQVRVDFERRPAVPVDLGTEYISPSFMATNSSMYFVTEDPAAGPNERVWWNDADPDPPLLSVQVIEGSSGQSSILKIRAQHLSCGNSRRDLHAGEASRDCEHAAVLYVDPVDNPQLTNPGTYQTPLSAPLVIEARRWHDPGGQDLVGRLVLDLRLTYP